eukprot:CAMPEP_0118687884 /NCGR_PEP_ID=MMETSP0800-20121206/8624_1 /TAXON_ID=210618 ORGANISM="Striatella unipunctata, Strain CCMP2910" /NCGR_SAMPLE_ID=MMETSP0800 /ASSEMBLY_ACC=CAM_ASM_000638 /LENGTH=361 /DNA_ID=CAMNT_0006585105 /DNA_START=576 /DNA_END=1661 /DNA_ORIENTATION=-
MSSSATEEDQTGATDRRAAGEFVRGISTARNHIGDDAFPPEPNRYHLFIAYNCPWCHRVSLVRGILGLEDSISMDVAFPNRMPDPEGSGKTLWVLDPDAIASGTGQKLPECTKDTATGKNFYWVRDIYRSCGIMDQTSVPILYDKKEHRIVSNESADIVRMISKNAIALGATFPLDLYPEKLSKEIDELNEVIYQTINNGAYKAGFSSNQQVYEEAYEKYFNSIENLEKSLAKTKSPFLLGNKVTEVDLRLFPTIYRHDPVYFLRMKLSKAMIKDYPMLWKWVRNMYSIPGVAESSNLVHCKQGYFGNSWNKVIPIGPEGYPQKYRVMDGSKKIRNSRDITLLLSGAVFGSLLMGLMKRNN